MSRRLALLLALVCASTPLALLISGGTGIALTATAALAVTGSGILLPLLLRSRTPRPAVLALLQVLAGLLQVLAVEAWVGALPRGGLTGALTGQVGLIAQGIEEIGSAWAPITLQAPGIVTVCLLITLAVIALEMLLVQLGQVALTAIALASFALIPVLSAPGGPWWTVAGPILAAVLVLGADALGPGDAARRRGGAHRPRRASRHAVPARLSALALAAVVVVAGAPVLGAALPMPSAARYPVTLEDVNRWLGRDVPQGPVMIDDSVSVRADLQQRRSTEVLRLTIHAASPEYLRLHTLSVYRDGRFSAEPDSSDPNGTAVQAGYPAVADIADQRDPTDSPLTSISVTDLGSDTLPAPAGVIALDLPSGVRLDASASDAQLDLAGGAQSLNGARYAVVSEARRPSADELETVAPELLRGAQGSAREDRVPAVIQRLASQVRREAGASGPFETARAYETFFHTQFTYDLDYRTEPGTDPIESFLAQRRGYCEQYAATFALMMRSQGYPTRVVVGFTQGTAEGSGEHVVTTADAHAWPEVYFGAEYGWVRFEPTPASAGAGIDEPDFEPAAAASDEASDAPTASASTSEADEATASETTASAAAAEASTQAPTPTGRAAQGGGAGGLLGVLGIVLLIGSVLAVLAALAVRRWRAARRERAWAQAARSGDPGRAAALLAWDEVAASRAGRLLDPTLPAGEALARMLEATRDEGAGTGQAAQGHADARGQADAQGQAAAQDRAAARLGAAVAIARYAPSAVPVPATVSELREDAELLSKAPHAARRRRSRLGRGGREHAS